MSAIQSVRMALTDVESVIFERPDLVDREAAFREVEEFTQRWLDEVRGRAYYEAQNHYSLSRVAELVGSHYDTVRYYARLYRINRRMPAITTRPHDSITRSRSAQQAQRTV